MSGGDLRTGMSPQTRVTASDTACSVKGVLLFVKYEFLSPLNYSNVCLLMIYSPSNDRTN